MLKDKVIVVTGASRGIGEAIARACVEAGARVVLASRKQADLDRVASSLGEQALALACHTGKADEVDAMMAKAVEKSRALPLRVMKRKSLTVRLSASPVVPAEE